jgi:hypothetical protein
METSVGFKEKRQLGGSIAIFGSVHFPKVKQLLLAKKAVS